jgi:hypothetical protein
VAFPQPVPLADGALAHVQDLNDDRFFAVFQGEINALNLIDAERGQAVYWLEDAAAIPYWETGTPLRLLLHWWLSRGPVQLIHGGAVGLPRGGVLLVGRGGSGKSTAAAACLDSPLRYAGDDYVLVRAEPQPYVYSLYNTAKLEPANLRRFPALLPALANADRLDTEKGLAFLWEHFPDRLALGFPVRAVLLPRFGGGPGTRLRPATPGEALLAAAPTTIFQNRRTGREVFEQAASLVRRAPAYVLETGTDLAHIPRVILRLLEELNP